MSKALLKQMIDANYPMVDYGKGVWLYDTEGRAYLDGSSGAMTANIGHGVPEIAQAVTRQMEKISFSYRTQFTNAPAEELAGRLAALAPGDLDYAFFVNSGSEASEHAIRVVLHVWRERGQPGKQMILGRERSYHGMTMGALSMSGHDLRRKDYGSLLHEFPAVPPSYCYRCPWGKRPESCGMDCAEAWREAIQSTGPENVAAIIVEPIVGAAGGVIMPPEGYLRRLREICDEYNVLMILDEVITGMGRTGSWFAADWAEVVPDVLTFGKGLSAGYSPMAGLLLRAPLVESMRQNSGSAPFGHTFSNNPLSAAACLAVQDYMIQNNVLDNVQARGKELEDGLRALARKHSFMVDVRGRGLLWGFEFVSDPATGEPPVTAKAVAARFGEICFDKGLIIYPSGVPPLNNAILLSPPLTISAEEITTLLEILGSALDDFAAVGALAV